MTPDTRSIATRLMRFSVERVTDDGVAALTTASDFYKVSEFGIPAHYVAVREKGAECTTRHMGRLHGKRCKEAVAAVLFTMMNESLQTTEG